MEKGLQTTFATVLGAVLLLVGILGFFVDGSLFGFGVNTLHNVVHLATGALLLWAGVWGGTAAARTWTKVFGVVYGLVTILGFLGYAGFLGVNGADNWLHLVITAAALWVGFGGKD